MRFFNLMLRKNKGKKLIKTGNKLNPETAVPKKRHQAVAGLLYALRVLGGALKLILIVLILVGSIVGGLGAGLIYGYIVTTPELSASDLQLTKFNTFIYDIEGNVIAELKRNENRVWIDYVDIPKNLINAYIAVEDKRFWEHKGVDFKRFIYAAFYSAKSYLRGEHTFQGGSTITQQMVKNLTGADDVTIKRKIQEMWQALKLEREGLSKEDILTRYLNTIPFGGTIYGIETAARVYYGKDVRELSLAECASLAGITQWPSKYAPVNEENKKNNIERAHMILGLMLEQGMITEAEYEQAMQEEIQFNYNPSAGKVTKNSNQSYFVDEVVKAVIKDLSGQKGISAQAAEDMIYNSGLKIYTTMDPKVQKALDEVFTDDTYFPQVNEEAKKRGETPQAAMVVIDPETGAVRGLYGGYGEKKGSVFNRATQMKRSPGSSIKPLLVYAPGIETGRITAATVIDDVPQHMLLNDTSIPEKQRTRLYPQNVERKNFGLTTIREAVAQSRNVIAALVLRDYTTFKVGLTYLEKVGLPRWEDEGKISIAMGGFTNQMSPLEMASAFTVFAYKGVYWEPYFYTKVEDVNGNVILEKNPKGTKVYSEQTAFIMNDILQDVVTEGTAAGLVVKNGKGKTIPVAGKTGTSDNNIDRWFCGMTPYYVAATWYGYDNKEVPISMVSAESANARKIWQAVMTKIHEKLDAVPFYSSVPPKIVTRQICKDSGKLATDLCRQDPRGSRVVEEYFIEGTEPDYGDKCDVHYKAKVCTLCKDEFGRPMLANEYCPPETVVERVFIRRPVEYKPMFPSDPYPADWYYEIYEGEYCTIHGGASANSKTENISPY
ncbi:penicillin-binding protein 1A [Thermoclostridium stercorarium subsp. leptospartum DSM 9219]|uniref:Penicillin-binding protein 1A n=1 Tax=Thermoclostridium stercorarium subsp. leptospartum DSM 9219 TaxID=1346611 RepID=A0A1B1YMM4_THEST|nr:PBP1A family penicillin-binding protein [Thermoclostridium stercorarium]ANX02003.1 penicillin-binding protein 1A [Thermoclostridium stercorarium subsp. leptospartum DSM 9219]